MKINKKTINCGQELCGVLHIGPSRHLKGGIASVISGYYEKRFFFESYGDAVWKIHAIFFL